MSSFRTRRSRVKQPSGIVLADRSNPLNSNLIAAFDLGNSLQDLSGNRWHATDASVVSTTPPVEVSAGLGKALRYTPNSSPLEGQRLAFPVASVANITGSWTVVAAVNQHGVGEGTFGRIIDTGSAESEGFFVLSSNTANCYGAGNVGGTSVISGPDIVADKWQLIVVTYQSGGNISWYIDGKLSGTPANPGITPIALSTSQRPSIGNRSGNNGATALDRDWDGMLGPMFIYNRHWTQAEALSLGQKPEHIYRLLKPTSTFFPVGAPSAGANTTGTLAVTLADATLAGIGGVTRSGTLDTTLADATLASIGAVTRSGTLAVTLADATLAGQGTVAVGANISGSAAITLADATLAGIGAVTRSGTTSTTLADATLAGVGAVTRSGTLSVTLDNATLTGVGTITGETVPVSHGGGMSQASNVSGKKKPKKKAKAVESEEWLKAEETARQLLQDRFKKTTPEAKAKTLEAHIESLQPIIQALKALSEVEESNTVQEKEPVQETRTEPKVEQPPTPIDRYDVLLRRLDDLEDLIVILMANQ